MAIPTSDIQVANMALARIKQRPISSIESPQTPAEDSVALIYDQTRRKLLRSYIFNFPRKFLVLTVDGKKEPAFGYENAFKLPNDFIRLLALGDITINADTPPSLYKMSEGYIFTDWEDDTDEINFYYVHDMKIVSKWDALFVDLMKLQLAHDLAPDFGVPDSKVKRIAEELREAKLGAAAVAGQEKPPRRIQRSRILNARRMGGRSRDLTYLPPG